MSTPGSGWSQAGRGRRHPELAWSYRCGGPLVALDLGLESGDVAMTSQDGRVHLIDQDGARRLAPRPMPGGGGGLAWSDGGQGGFAQIGKARAAWIDRDLQVRWDVEFHTSILDLAVSPFGNVVAASLEDSTTMVLDAEQQRIGEYTSVRPLQFLHLVANRPVVIGSAETGTVCSFSISGGERWSERIWSNVGSLAVNNNGKTILLAAFNQGVQRFSGSGRPRGFYELGGTVSLVAISYIGTIIVAATYEQQLLVLDSDGQVLWQASLPEPVSAIACDAFGESVYVGFASGTLQRLTWPPWSRPRVEEEEEREE